MRSAASIVSLLLITVAVHASTARVKYISDGDSFILASGERVRMIGINSPELAEKFGPQAKDHLSQLIRGKSVTLEGDPLNDDRDVHGRLLRFVTLDGADINLRMIADGYASAFLRYPFAREKRKAYSEAEASAKAAGLGIWAGEIVKQAPAINSNTTFSPPKPFFPGRTFLLVLGAGALIFLVVIALVIRRS